MRSERYVRRWLAIAGLLAALSTAAYAQQDPPAAGDEAQLIAVLQSDAELFAKAKACQRLAVIGTADCVPVLAGLLEDEQLSHYARTGLEPIPAAAVDEALRTAMSSLQGGLKVGVINSIGMRRDSAAVDELKKLLGDSDLVIAAAAAAALGRIATDDAVAALQKALDGPAATRPAVADACLTAADMLIADDKSDAAAELYQAMLDVKDPELPSYQQTAALHGAARTAKNLELLAELLTAEDTSRFAVGLRMAHELEGEEVTKTLMDALADLSPTRGGLVIHVLGDRGAKSALPLVLAAAKDGPPETRLPAITVLAEMGDKSAVPVLLAAATNADEELAAAARDSLIALPGEEIDAVLLENLEDGQAGQQAVLVELIGQRGITSAVPELLALAGGSDQELRQAALAALGLTVGPGDLSALIGQLVEPKAEADVAVTQAALSKAVLRMPDRDACAAELLDAVSTAPTAAKVELLNLLGTLGGEKALDGIVTAAREGDDEVQDAATRVLGEWMSADAAPRLLELAETLDSDKYKIRALRGYIRIPRQFGMTAEARLEMCRKALAVAERDAERALVLDAATRSHTPEALEMVVSYLDQPGLKDAAGEAAVSIAEKLLQTDRPAVAAAMQKVIDAGATGETAVQAKILLRRAKR
jgi:HEAT repeat protein